MKKVFLIFALFIGLYSQGFCLEERMIRLEQRMQDLEALMLKGEVKALHPPAFSPSATSAEMKGLREEVDLLKKEIQRLSHLIDHKPGAVGSIPQASSNLLTEEDIIQAILKSPPPPVLKKETTDTQAQYQQALALFEKGEFKPAASAFSYFIKTYPEDAHIPQAHYWLGKTYLSLNQLPSARLEFVKSYQKDPKDPRACECLFELGKTFLLEDRKSHACTIWGKLVKDFPNRSLQMNKSLKEYAQKAGCKGIVGE